MSPLFKVQLVSYHTLSNSWGYDINFHICYHNYLIHNVVVRYEVDLGSRTINVKLALKLGLKEISFLVKQYIITFLNH